MLIFQSKGKLEQFVRPHNYTTINPTIINKLLLKSLLKGLQLWLAFKVRKVLKHYYLQSSKKILRSIKKLGITTIIVEQNAIAALKLADRAVIIDMGRKVFDGTAQEVLDDEALRNEYLAI